MRKIFIIIFILFACSSSYAIELKPSPIQKQIQTKSQNKFQPLKIQNLIYTTLGWITRKMEVKKDFAELSELVIQITQNS